MVGAAAFRHTADILASTTIPHAPSGGRRRPEADQCSLIEGFLNDFATAAAFPQDFARGAAFLHARGGCRRPLAMADTGIMMTAFQNTNLTST
jgi:hypothetical protein